ncbi:hypothetical protein AQ490_04430 [Wenjunlia vitaminophila]|uniref:DUF4350 domain-containing protein n=1 Tax=Wenjunlia vitaminophila TaxID=76728 RepID=A0A0T6LPR7_WENVI|nr:DUF4350 domain-containing protein [Wenjunlia vitaminophila]KRV47905.1 hypothetical protein AQ490_04430 [Wenjunlia vitaminophila]
MAPTVRQLWARSRGILVALLILLVFGFSYAVFRSGEHHGQLDPRSPDRYGSRAVAQLLEDHGVTVDVVTTTADAAAATGPDSTLLVTDPDMLDRRQLGVIHQAAADSGGRTVLIAPGPTAVSTLLPGVDATATAGVDDLAPACDLPEARRAGDAHLGGLLYRHPGVPGATSCYPVQGLPSLLRVPDTTGQGDTVVLGTPDPFHNHRLDDEGNASLALQLLGSRPHLVWYLPSLSDDSVGEPERQDFSDLLPSGWRWGAWQLAVAAVVTALWRARRLGPVVTEPLPVAVRAAEATEGRARLYRRANARARAAEALRQATRARLAPLVGVEPSRAQEPDILLAALTAHVEAPAPQVRSLLYGPAPEDDSALVRLADDLDALEASLHDWQVRSP